MTAVAPAGAAVRLAGVEPLPPPAADGAAPPDEQAAEPAVPHADRYAAACAAALARLRAGEPALLAPREFAAAGTDLPPVTVHCGPELDPGITGLAELMPPRGLQHVDRESLLALTAAAPAAVGLPPDARAGTGVVWATQTAGLHEYGRVCGETATAGPGLTDPGIGPQSAFNAPAAVVSMRLGLGGPHLTLTGGRTAGAHALAEVARMCALGRAPRVLVGASVTVSRLALAAAPDGAAAPAEGAAALILTAGAGAPPLAIRRGRCRDAGVLPAAVLAHLREAGGDVVVSADPAVADAALAAVRAAVAPRRAVHLEATLGDLGCAGALAVLALAQAAARTESWVPAAVLVVEDSGEAAALHVPAAHPAGAGQAAAAPGRPATTRPPGELPCPSA